MDSLLQKLRTEMIDLRDSSHGLTKQMWLLYVTFEDFVCLHHPKISADLISSSVNIDSYLDQNSFVSFSGRRTIEPDPVSKDHNSNNTVTKVPVQRRSLDSYSQNQITNQPEENCTQTALCMHIDKNCVNSVEGENIVSYRFAYRHCIRKSRRETNKDFKNIHEANSVKLTNSMALSRPDRRTRTADKMRDYSAQNTKNKTKCYKSATSGQIDKPHNVNDIIPCAGIQHHERLSRDCVPRQKQIRTRAADNGCSRRYNPALPASKRCLNEMDERFSSNNNCVGNERRLNVGKSCPRNNNTHSQVKNKCEDKDSLVSRITNLCWAEDSEITPPRIQRPTELFTDRSKNFGDLKRYNAPISPRSDATITPDSSRSAKRHCVFEPHHTNSEGISSDSGLDRNKSLSDSFDQVTSVASPFDDPVSEGQGDMSQVHCNDSSPVTISSGYESDSIPTCEAEIDNIFFRNKSKPKDTEPTTDYFSLSETYPPNLDTSVVSGQNAPKVILTRVPEKAKTVKDSTVTCLEKAFNFNDKLSCSSNQGSKQGLSKRLAEHCLQIPDKSSVRNIRATEATFHSLPVTPRQLTNNQAQTRFSPVQRNNYQLTKVARSMFEIIHDLQMENCVQDNNKKKCRKVKRAPMGRGDNTVSTSAPDITTIAQRSSSDTNLQNPSTDIESRRHSQPVTGASDNGSKLPIQQGKLTVKCLRRPLGSNSVDFLRANELPHSSSAVNYLDDDKPATPHRPIQSVKVLRQPGQRRFDENNPVFVNQQVSFPDGEKTLFVENGCSPYATTKLPGCWTPKRDDKLDDHVYETIPGDEFLYEELMRMRALGILSPRFCKIPDLPGHFVPFEPPALPARNMDNLPQQGSKYILMRDHNSNLQTIPPFAGGLVQSGSKTEPLHQKSISKSSSWDGYCSLDTDLPQNSAPKERPTTTRSTVELFNSVDDAHQPPSKRRENFYLLLSSKQKRADFSESLELETKLKEMGIVLDDRCRGAFGVDGYSTMDGAQSLDFQSQSDRLHFLPSTYV